MMVMHSSGSWDGGLKEKYWQTNPKILGGVRNPVCTGGADSSAELATDVMGSMCLAQISKGTIGGGSGSKSLNLIGSWQFRHLDLHCAKLIFSPSCSPPLP